MQKRKHYNNCVDYVAYSWLNVCKRYGNNNKLKFNSDLLGYNAPNTAPVRPKVLKSNRFTPQSDFK